MKKLEQYMGPGGKNKTAQLATETESPHEIILADSESSGYHIVKGKTKTKVKVSKRRN